MGNAILNGIANRENTIVEAPTGTGKSLAALLPSIEYVLNGDERRVVVSTATKNLQDQYLKDLKELKKIYGNKFEFQSLKGRDNYICFNRAKTMTIGNKDIRAAYDRINRQRGALGGGERSDVERILRRELSSYEWSFLSGAVNYCSENKCKAEECFSTLARERALAADIVVTNNAIVKVDADTRDLGDDSFLGPVDILIIDEAHELEASLISGWTEEFSERQLTEMTNSITEGLGKGERYVKADGLWVEAERLSTHLIDYIKAVLDFYGRLHGDEKWENVTDVVSTKYVMRGASAALIESMVDYEKDRFTPCLEILDALIEYFDRTYNLAQSGEGTLRKLGKAFTASKNLRGILTKLSRAMESRNGIFMVGEVPYTVVLKGFVRRNGDRAVSLSVTPLDISSMAKKIWEGRICILMSATLRDLEDGSFRYIKASLGIEANKELILDTVFDLVNKQITYITKAEGDVAPIPGAQFSMKELIELIHAAKGRTLVLFTARSELNYAAETLLASDLDYPIHVQYDGVNKTRLAESFKNEENSVLLATKSFFQGADFPGETLSLVVLVKYPLPQYSALCKNQIEWWRTRGFPRWYSSRSLEVFHQAAGRLIRTENDYGVVALLDQRVVVPGSNVFETASKAVKGLHSPVIRTVNEVETFLGGSR